MKLSKNTSLKHCTEQSFSKFLLSVITATAFIFVPTVVHPKEPGIVQLPKNSGMSCEDAINSVKTNLIKRGYFIPWKTSPSEERLIKPRVALDKKQIQDNYYDYPPNRTEAVSFLLSGDSDELYQGFMSSPQLMATLSAQIMAECDQVGLVVFVHWYESYVPVGYFPDNTVQTFTWIESNDDSSYVRSIETVYGSKLLFQWGYYYSP